MAGRDEDIEQLRLLSGDQLSVELLYVLYLHVDLDNKHQCYDSDSTLDP